MGLYNDILMASKGVGIDPYNTPFKPSDLNLDASKYGSFSDYCSEDSTCSGKWADGVILRVVQRDRGDRPMRYLLIKK